MSTEHTTRDIRVYEQLNRSIQNRCSSITLTQEDPLERLEQLCEQGLYSYSFHHDDFQNGVMCMLKLKVGKYGQTIIKEARFIKPLPTDSEGESLLVRAKKTVAAILLDKLDLGVVESDKQPEVDPVAEEDPEEEVDDTEIRFQEMASKGLNVMFEALNKVMSSDMMKGYADE